MNCKTIRMQLMASPPGELATEVRHSIEAHLSGCTACSKYARVVTDFCNFIENEKSVSYDPFMVTRVMQAFNNKKQVLPGIIRKLQPAFITLIMALVILAGINLGKIIGFHQTLSDDYKTELFYLDTLQDENLETILLSE